MDAMTMMTAKARLAYYDALSHSAPERIETVPFREVLRKLLRLERREAKERPMVLAPAEKVNG